MEMNLEVPFDTSRHAQVAYDALRVDKEPKRSGMVKTLELKDNILSVKFNCDEARVMRVSVNAFLDLLALVTETMEQFDD
jgi:EKC/KEOPS complex subunit PCC1/LAGE3